MPELPEVESVRIQLGKYLSGHKIESVDVGDRKVLKKDEGKLEGGKVKKVRRFGKVLAIDLDNGYSAVIHIKLTGQLIYRGPKLKNPPKLSKKVYGGFPGKHTHVVFNLDKEGKLYYNDYRKFGWIKVVETDDVEKIDFIKKLGPEPLDGLSPKKFKQLTSSTRRTIKTLLMDQAKIGGVGNIYANDALWLAKINPKTPSNELSDKKVKELYKAIKKVLKKGLELEGASELAFVMPSGEEGSYQDHTLVYGKEGEKCKRGHNAKIKKIKLAGRGTYFCPVCQK
jgi:formamidopyrimidine-DNA glycosylase